MNNITVANTMKIATLAGASILVVNSAMGLLKVSSPKGAIMPVISILVGFAAFKYAMGSTAPTVVKK